MTILGTLDASFPRAAGDALADQAAEPTCQHCHAPLPPRSHGGGQRKRFCSDKCRSAFHAGCAPPSNPPSNSSAQPSNAPALPMDLPTASEAPKERALVLAQNEITLEHSDERGEWIIRQKNWPDDDAEIFINDEAIHDFIDRLTDALGYGGSAP